MRLQKSNLTERIHKESLLEQIRSEDENTILLLEWSQLLEQPLGWRATWMLRQVLAKNDPRLKNHISAVLERFPNFNESQKREWIKLLEHQETSDDEEGILYDLCMLEWKNIHNHPALRASAILVVFKILKKYPELANELNHLMSSDYLESLSPGIKRVIIKNWNLIST